MCYLKPDEAQSQFPVRWISLFSKCSWIQSTATRLSYELGVNGEKMSMESRILLIEIGIEYVTLVNLLILTV